MLLFYFVTPSGEVDFYRYSLFHNLILDDIFVIIGWIVAPFIGLWAGNFIGLIFLRVYKKIIGKKKEFYIVRKSSQIEYSYKFSNSFFSALISISLAMIISNNSLIQGLLLSDFALIQVEIFHSIYLFPLILVFTTFFSIAVYSASIFLFESGIVTLDKKKEENFSELIEIKRIGSFYLTLFKGYAGISVILNLFLLAFEGFLAFGEGSSVPLRIIFLIYFWLFPFIISFFMFPVSKFIEKTYDKRIQRYLKYATKLGISVPLDEVMTFKL